MKVIHKFRLATDSKQVTLTLKESFKIVHSEYVLVDKSIYIWVEQTLDVEALTQQVTLKVIKSGDPLTDNLQHVASVVDSFTPEAYHIFREPEAAPKEKPLNLALLTYRAA